MNAESQPVPFLFRFAEQVSGPMLEGTFNASNDVWMVKRNGEKVPLIRLPYVLIYTQSTTKVRNETSDRD